MKILIQHGRVVHPVTGTVLLQDLLIEDGKIALLDRGLETDADLVIPASGLVVCPGLVDMHVHLRDPGLTYKEDILTGTAAAAHGGVTSVACMANTDPVVDSPEQIEYILNRARFGSGVHVYPIGAVSMGLRGEEPTDAEALKKAGAIALSDDGCNVDNANLMRDVLIRARRLDMPVLCHCEDTSMVEGRAVNEGSVSRQLWLEGRPAIAEELMVMRDAMLAEETGAHVHICHVSTARSVDIIRKMKKKGVHLTCETCPQYFWLTEDEILTQGSMARVNPPLRTAQDVKGIIAGLKDGTIDVIATDHAPHSAEEKARPLTRAPSGMVGLETSLARHPHRPLPHGQDGTARHHPPHVHQPRRHPAPAQGPHVHGGGRRPDHLRPRPGVDHRPGAVRLQGPEHPLRRKDGEGPGEVYHRGRPDRLSGRVSLAR